MSYQVLARKYRPHSFEELVGQEHVVQALANALTQQRLHHAYLFTGTRGVGKTTVSRILAKSLNCTGPDGMGTITATPCGVCDACQAIDAGRFVDYIELDAASNRGVEEISQLLDQSVYKPVMGRFKVYMIDEVHMLSNTAFNAMLKTLEEPPDYLKFVLATTDPQKVPVTVLSRCLQFNLRPMAPQTVLSHLTQVLKQESVPADAGALRLLSRAARGSMRDALSLTDQAIAFGAGSLVEEGVRQMLGTVDRGHVVAIIDALAAADGAAVVAQADGLRALGLSAAGTLEDLAGLLQQMAVAQAAPGALDETDPDTAEAERLAALLPADEIQLMYSMALHGRAELALAPDEYAGLLMVLLRMLSFRPAGAAGQTLNRPAAALARPVRATPPAAAVAPAVSPAVAPLVAAVPAPAAAPVLAPEPLPAPELPLAELAGVELVPPARPIRVPQAQEPVAAAYQPQQPVPEAVPEPAAPAFRTRPAEAQAAGGNGHSARLRPRPVVHAAVVEDEPGDGRPSDDGEPPPWLDAPMGDEDGAAGSYAGGAAFDEGEPAQAPRGSREPAGRQSYASTAGEDVPLQPTELGAQWAALIAPMGLLALTRELAVRSECVALENGPDLCKLRLRVERESLRQPALRDKLQVALEAGLQKPVQIELEAGVPQDSPALRDLARIQARQRQVEQIVLDDPIAQALMTQFKTARIVPGSIRSH
ncbi:DNA polymerase III subunit gamma/tau [Paucibacter sp. DJ1R-11]|uniref:DNA polymerase III subunit gamma/tau n=1 Tax=Paucibacter sp. DJ1R-11 TaxID=2893556 RepID=UPI0021E490DC|nr:DNA polymerase III subunit gamma/tau [Paucibacter sp. DJ1R-11]MCV2364252.1 DNA polymerase III subunit gamma/tau [Paucibacter sp. DJ1R-11]